MANFDRLIERIKKSIAEVDVHIEDFKIEGNNKITIQICGNEELTINDCWNINCHVLETIRDLEEYELTVYCTNIQEKAVSIKIKGGNH